MSAGVRIAVVTFGEGDRAALEKEARAVMAPGARVPEGASAWRTLEFFAGRAALARVLAALGYRGVVVPDPEYGYLVTRPAGPFVNVSHTKGIAVAVAGPASVGIDVEAVDRDPSRALERVATDEERAALGRIARVAAEGGEVPAPIALWSAKEAVSKAVGLGIKFGMRAFVPSLEGAAPHGVKVGIRGPLSLANPAVRFLRQDRYLVSVCTERDALRSSLEASRIRMA